MPAPGHVSFGTRRWRRCRCRAGCACWSASAAPVSPGRHADPVVRGRHPDLGITLSIGLYLMLARHAVTRAGRRELADDAEPMPAARAGAPIGRYAMVERIGQGGMAEIFSAVTMGEGSFRRPVVIKRLRPELIVDPNAVAQFCDEANLLAALHHPNIVAVHDFGRSGEPVLPGRGVRVGPRPRPGGRAPVRDERASALPRRGRSPTSPRAAQGARVRT